MAGRHPPHSRLDRSPISNALDCNDAITSVLALPDMQPGSDVQRWVEERDRDARIIQSTDGSPTPVTELICPADRPCEQ